nr:uncharacterized protein LOC109770180 [Aegilops tauschii subsp. strangulata]
MTTPATGVIVPGAADPGLGAAGSDPGAATLDPVQVVVLTVVTASSWAQSILAFLESEVLPMDKTEARQVEWRASSYSIINNELVKCSAIGMFQRCVEEDKGI